MKYYTRVIWIVLLMALGANGLVKAQVGKQFWFVAPDITSDHGYHPVVLRITADTVDVRVKVKFPANPALDSVILDIPAYSQKIISNVTHPSFFQLNTGGESCNANTIENCPINTKNNKGLYVEVISGGDISCYYQVNASSGATNPDVFTLKGQNALGTDFVVPSQNGFPNATRGGAVQPREQINIVATEDGTKVKIKPSDKLLNSVGAGDSIEITLNKGQTYSIASENWTTASRSLGGTVIHSDKKIAVTVSDDSVQSGGPNDLIGDQIVPTSIIGKQYIAVRATGLGNQNLNQVYITAVEDGTIVSASGYADQTLSKGQVFGFPFLAGQTSMQIAANKPVYAYMLSGIYTSGQEFGSALLPPVEGCTGSKRVNITRVLNAQYWVQILTKSANRDKFSVSDDSNVKDEALSNSLNRLDKWQQVGSSDWYVTSRDMGGPEFGTSGITTGKPYTISNNGLFHLSVFDQNGASMSYGYFSSYNSVAIEGPSKACVNDKVILSAKHLGGNYSWTSSITGSTILSTSNTLEVTKSAIYYLQRDEKDGCIAVDALDVKISQPVFTMPNPGTVCPNIPLTLRVTPATGNTYKWYEGTTLVSSTDSLRYTPVAGQTRIFAVTATSTADNCTSTQKDTVITVNAEQVSLSSGLGSVCLGDTIKSNSDSLLCKWSLNGTPMPAYDNKQYIIASATGTYSVVGTSKHGCQSTDSETITVNALPVVDITDQTVCYNTPANYTLPVMSDVVYTWDNPTSGIVGTSYSKLFTTTNPDKVWVKATQTYTNPSGTTSTCSAKDSAMVTWRPEQTVTMNYSIGGATAQPALDEIYTCTEAPVTLSAPAGFSIYTWKVGSAAPVSGPAIYTQLVTVAAGSSEVVTLTVTDGNGCTATDAVTVRGRPVTTPVTDKSVICLGEVATVTTSLNSYEWRFGGVVIAGATSNSYTPTVAGTYVVSGRDNNNCLTASTNVTVNPLPAFTLTGAIPCAGNPFVYGANVSSAGTHTYLWSQVGNPITSTATTYPVTLANETTLELRNSTTGCKATQKGTPSWTPLPSVSLSYVNSLGQTVTSSSADVCPGAVTTLTGTASAGGGGAFSYAWYVNNILVSGQTAPTLSFTIPSSGSTNIRVTVTANGCSASDDITLNVLPNPDGLLTALPANICLGSPLSVESIRNSIANHTWSFGGAVIHSLYTFIPTTAGSYTLNITTPQGCTASKVFTVSDPAVAINAPSVVEACSNTNRTFTVTPVKTGYNYVWSNNLNATTTSGSSYTATQPGVYTVTATHATLGCIDAESVQYKWTVDTLLSIGNTLSVCSNAAIDLTATSTLSNYKWTSSVSGGASLSSVNTYTIPAGTADNTVFTVTANYVNGTLTCPISQSFNYKVLAVMPALTLDPSLSCAPNKVCLCEGEQVILEANNGFVKYQWYEIIAGNPTILGAQTSKTLTVSVSGDHTYKLRADQSNGCFSEGNVDVSVTPLPDLTLTPSAPVVCENTPFTIFNSALTASMYEYEWTKNLDPTVHTNWPITGSGYEKITYNIIAKDKTRPECRVSGQQEINSPAAPTIALQDQSICSNSTYDLSTQFNNSTIPGATHKWVFGGSTLGSTVVNTQGRYDLSVDVVDMGITCTYNKDMNLKVVPIPNFSGIKATNETCDGVPAILDATGNYYNYQWSYYGNSYANPVDATKTYPNERTIETSDEGFYRVSAWVLDGISCTSTSSDTIELIVNDLPVLSVDLNPATPIYLCSGSSLNLVASNASGLFTTYSWSNGKVGATNTVFTSGNYEVTGVDSKGCVDKTFETVVDYVPTDVVLAPFKPICKGQSFTLPSITGVAAYQWLENNLAIPSPYIVKPIKTTVYVLNYLTEANGCWIQKNFTVTVLPVPILSLTAPSKEFCDGETHILDAGAAGAYSYEWSRLASGGSPAVVVGNSQNYSATTTGNYQVVATTNEGCTTTATANVVFNSNPIVSLGTDFPWCPDSLFTLAIQNTIGLSGYVWSTGAADNGKSSITSTKGGEYWVKAFNAKGCSTTDYIDVSIYPRTIVELPTIAPVCDNSNTTLISPLNVPSQIINYQWFYGSIGNSVDPANPSNPSLLNNPWTVTAAGEYFIRVRDLNGCVVSNSLDLVMIPAPKFELGPDREGCVNDSLKITEQNSYVRYMWNNDPADNNYFKIVDPSFPKYRLLVEDRNGCIAEDSVRYVANPLPVPYLGEDLVKCPDFTILTPAGGPYNTIIWSTGDSTPSISATAGDYSVTVEDSNGCVGVDNVNITWLEKPNPVIEGKTLICQNEDLPIMTTEDYESYEWHNGATSKIIIADVVPIINVVTVVAKNGCSNFTTRSIYREPSPDYHISPDTTLCANYTYTLDAGEEYPFVRWSTGSTYRTLTLSANKDTTYTVFLEASDNCVTVYDTVVVKFNDMPQIQRLDTMIYAQINIVAIGGLPPYMYTLNQGNLQASNAFKYLSNGVYEAYVEDANKCWDIDSVTINSVLDIDIPNFFTPNRDGYNDSWVVNGLQDRFPDANIIIYDRYNRQIIRLKGDGDGWDGTYLGKDMPSDDYWFVINLVHVNKTLKGNITLKR